MATGRSPRRRGLPDTRDVPVISDSDSEANTPLASSVADSDLSSDDDLESLSGVKLQKLLVKLQSERRANEQLKKAMAAKNKEAARLLKREKEAEELEVQNARLEEVERVQNLRQEELLGEVQRLRREVGEHEAVALGPQRSAVAAGLGVTKATSDFNADAWKERLEQDLDEASSELNQASRERDEATARAEDLEVEARRRDLEAAHLRHLLQCQEAESLKLRADLQEREQIAAAREQRLESPPLPAAPAQRPSAGREAFFPGSLAEELELDAEESEGAEEPEGATGAQRVLEGLPASYEAQLMSLEDHLSRARSQLDATRAAQLQQSSRARAQDVELSRLGKMLQENEAALARAEAALVARSEAVLAEQSSLLEARGRVARLQAELAEARSRLAAQETLDQTASDMVQAAELALARSEAALADLEGSSLTAQGQALEQSDAARAQVASLEAELAETRSRFFSQEASLQAASDRAQVAEAALARSEAALAEQATAREQALEQSEAALARSEAASARSEAALAEQSSLLVAGLQAELADARTRLAAQEALDQAAADRAQAMEAALARSETAVADLQGSLLTAREQALEQSSQAAQAQVAALEADLAEARSQLAIQEAALDRAQVVDAALARSEAVLAEQVTAREQALEQSTVARAQVAGLQAELAEARPRLAAQEVASDRARVAEAALARSEATLVELQGSLQTARGQALEQSDAAQAQALRLDQMLSRERRRADELEAELARSNEAAVRVGPGELGAKLQSDGGVLWQRSEEKHAELQRQISRLRLKVPRAAAGQAPFRDSPLAGLADMLDRVTQLSGLSPPSGD